MFFTVYFIDTMEVISFEKQLLKHLPPLNLSTYEKNVLKPDCLNQTDYNVLDSQAEFV